MGLSVLPLGAGQDVGRSCVVVRAEGLSIMFDCGIHMGYADERRYPDFALVTSAGSYTEAVDVVVITHFHLDHSGALPYFTQVCGFRGPVIMTHPTKALLPLMLQDYHKVMVTRKGEKEMFTRQDIQDCISQVQGVDLHASVQVGDRIRLVAHYAGHVLGGAMFEAHLGSHHVVYTGDFNTTPDRHLSAARLPCLRPDLLISEATYATTIRDSKRAREREFLDQVHETVAAGGKVLIPVFAMGRAQDLQLMLHDFWKRMRMQVPMYSSAGMMLRANQYYRLLLRWTNPHVQAAYMKQPFPTMQRWEPELATAPGPCVLFATPGMLHGGVSLQVFKQWAGDARNLVVLPGYCIAGTLAAQLLASPSRTVKVDASTTITARCRLLVAAFSAHTDARGILGLLHQAEPRTTMLVHGEKAKMEFLQARIQATLAIPCFCPANGSLVTIPRSGTIPIRVAADLLDQAFRHCQRMEVEEAGDVVEGVVLGRGCGPGQLKDLQLVGREAAQQLLAAGPQFALAFQSRVPADVGALASPATLLAAAAEELRTQLQAPSPGVRVDTAASSVAVGCVTAVLQQGRSCTEAAGLPLESEVPPAASAAAARLAEWVKESADVESDGPGQVGGVLAAGRDESDPGSVPAEVQDALLDDTAAADFSGNAAAGHAGPSIKDREAETEPWTWLVQWAAEDEQLARSCMAALRSLKL